MGGNTTTAALRGFLLAALLVSALACTQACFAYNPGDPEYRAFWVDAWHAGGMNQSQVNTLLGIPGDANSKGQIRDANCNTVVFQVRRDCNANYPSTMGEPYMSGLTPSNFNALQAVINAAHDTTGGKKRIEVHACLVTFRTSGGAVYQAHNDTPTGSLVALDNYWPSRDDNGSEVSDQAFDPGHPLAEEYTVNVAMDIVNHFDIDGIQYDYIRFTANNQGYNPTSIARYNARYGLDGNPVYSDEQFKQWRRDQVSAVVRKIYAKIQAVKPWVKQSGSVVTWNSSPGSSTRAAFQGTRPYGDVYSDWDSWLQEGILDAAFPMTYYDYADSATDYIKWMNFEKDRHGNRHMVVGPGIYMNSLSNSILEIQKTRDLSPAGSKADGFCGFSYFAPYTNGGTNYGTWGNFSPLLSSQVTTTWADVPTMPWKTSPTKGHISGTVTLYAGGPWADGANVSITGPTSRSMLCDGTGFYAFIDLPPGTYTVTASKSGYPNNVQTVAVEVGSVLGNMYVLDFELASAPPPLVISDVQVPTETQSGATITWTTNTASSSKVYYGLDRTCSSSTVENAAQVYTHSVTLSGLQAARTYYFRAYSHSSGGTSATSPIYALVTDPATPADIIIDNPSASLSGSWSVASSSGDKYGADYLVAYGNDGLKTATFRPNVQAAGTYNVYEWHTQGGNRCSSVPITVTYNGGSHVYYVNEQSGGGTWNLLGSHSFAAGTSGSASVNNLATGGAVVIADAIKFAWGAPVDSTVPSTPAGLAVTGVQDDSISLSWTASTDNIGIAGYRISRSSSLTAPLVVIDSSPTSSYTDNDVLPNTRYWYSVSAYDTSGNKSGASATINTWSLTAKPSYTTVLCDKQTGVWQTSGPFTFTSFAAPWGAAKVNYYRCAWDTSPTHTWTDTETPWVGGTKVCTATSAANPYYLHIRGYNQAAVAGESSDFGPYYFDSTVPVINSAGVSPAMAAEGDAVHVVVDATDGVAATSVTANGTPLVLSGGNTWTGDILALGPLGAHNITIVAKDAAGNSATNESATYKTARIFGTSNAAAWQQMMNTARETYLFSFWGKVTEIDDNYFTLGDGSVTPVTVHAPGYKSKVVAGDYASARGILNIAGSTRWIESELALVTKY